MKNNILKIEKALKTLIEVALLGFIVFIFSSMAQGKETDLKPCDCACPSPTSTPETIIREQWSLERVL
jgi:hypothetical protein